ncbi:MAG: preprotein translocase subunit SecE [Phycisphaerales bacterium]|nr:preprotein translocase subunit SecE [Phycisphaerales bacterium]
MGLPVGPSMAIGIYKPGQGYWVRVLTAVGAGVLLLACAAWVWSQGALIKIPAGAWRYTLGPTQGATAAGATLDALAIDPVTAQRASFGQAVVRSLDRAEAGGTLIVEPPVLRDGTSPASVVAFRGDGGFEASIASVSAVPMFEQLYLQAGMVAVVLLVGMWLIYRLTARSPRAVEFLIATDGEMKKVNWSTRREVIGSTWVVIVACVLIAGFLYVVDQAFAAFFDAVGVLER